MDKELMNSVEIGQIAELSVTHKRSGKSRNASQGLYCKKWFSCVDRKWSNKFKKERKLGNKARNIRGLRKSRMKPVNVTFSATDLSGVLVQPLPDISAGLNMQGIGRLTRIVVPAPHGPTGYPVRIDDHSNPVFAAEAPFLPSRRAQIENAINRASKVAAITGETDAQKS